MAKSYRSKLSDPNLLLLAWKGISKSNRRSRGMDNVSIESFKANLHEHIAEISKLISLDAYWFGPTRGVLLEKAGGGTRPIKVPDIRDRVVMKALGLLLKPHFAGYDLACSYGYIEGRGVRSAASRVTELLKSGHEYVLEADISKFFDTVDRELLLSRFLRVVKSRYLRDFVEAALRVEVGNLKTFEVENRSLFPSPDSGIPQGGVLSPMLANFYLHPFDQAMTRKGFQLVRYADDFVVLCKDDSDARRAHELAKSVIEDRLQLTLHPLGSPKTRIIRAATGFEFLGLRFGGGRVEPADKVVQKFKDKVDELFAPSQNLKLVQILTQLNLLIRGWGEAFRTFDSQKAFHAADEHVANAFGTYMRNKNFLQLGHNISNQMKHDIGIESLYSRYESREAKKKSASA